MPWLKTTPMKRIECISVAGWSVYLAINTAVDIDKRVVKKLTSEKNK